MSSKEKITQANPLILIAGIILIPLGVALVSVIVDARIDKRQRQLSEALFERQERLAIAQMIDSYFQGVGEVMMNQMDADNRKLIIVAKMQGINLRWANLKQARLEGAILDAANLNGAHLGDAVRPNTS